jgi:hypothetical protein
VTILDTYHARFEIGGESHHAVPIDGDEGLRSSSGGVLFRGPVNVRREGEDVWVCHSRGYQIPRGARIMVSSSRAPAMIATTEIGCGYGYVLSGEVIRSSSVIAQLKRKATKPGVGSVLAATEGLRLRRWRGH